MNDFLINDASGDFNKDDHGPMGMLLAGNGYRNCHHTAVIKYPGAKNAGEPGTYPGHAHNKCSDHYWNGFAVGANP